MNTQQAILDLTQRAISLSGRPGATRVYVVSLSAAIAAVAGTEQQASPLSFQEDGTVLAIYGQEQAGTAAKYAKTEVRVQIGAEDLFTTGQAGAFVPMLALFPPGQPYFPIMRRVQVGVPWNVTFRNQDGAATATPTLCLAFIADADLRRAAR